MRWHARLQPRSLLTRSEAIMIHLPAQHDDSWSSSSREKIASPQVAPVSSSPEYVHLSEGSLPCRRASACASVKRSSAVGCWFSVVIGTVSTGTVWVSMMLLGEAACFSVSSLPIAAVISVGETTRGMAAFRSVSAYLSVISGGASSDQWASFGDSNGLAGTMPCSSSSVAPIAAWERFWVVVVQEGGSRIFARFANLTKVRMRA